MQRARDAGVGASRLRAKDLLVVTRGARLHVEHTFRERCRTVLAAMHERAFANGVSAAILHGLPVPQRCRDVLELAVPAPMRGVRRRGVTARSLRIREDEITRVRGIRSTTMTRAWCELSRTLTVPELVAAGDVAVRTVDREALSRAARERGDSWLEST